ncbi:hypothetical protein [Leucobacter triazinivorans]|uniref:Uncharacterized protein n=1 Tax=Leucobacter triazinivorans TaxID=1784719 RepID=A0A4P6KG19_9MICO|nr:hypothetical protein [Leucobacter triazinivorans]QBE49376.1 hypothetical protein EVS81_11460 [Leucobacter triazinivorans]
MSRDDDPAEDTVVAGSVEEAEEADAFDALDATVVADAADAADAVVVAVEGDAADAADAVVVAVEGDAADEVDATVVAPFGTAPGTAPGAAPRSPERSRGATGNPAPPVPEPERAGLPPALAARMFKSPLDPRYRVPAAPTGAPEHALPRRGVSPGLPVVSATRTELRPTTSDAPLEQRVGPIPDSTPQPPAAPRDGLRSIARADRRFGAVALAGFAAAVLCSALGLWGVAVLAFG